MFESPCDYVNIIILLIYIGSGKHDEIQKGVVRYFVVLNTVGSTQVMAVNFYKVVVY